MIRHIFKMVWNRKGANALVILEIFISFLVVFAVVATATQLYSSYQEPLGFNYDNLLDVGVMASFAGEPPSDFGQTIERMRTELLAHDEVQGVAVAVFEPYSSGRSWRTRWGDDANSEVEAEIMRVSPTYLEVLGLELLAGRWFEPGDQQMHWTPLVISQEMAREMYGEDDPIGQVIADEGRPESRVIGVVSTFRRMGEFKQAHNVAFLPIWPEDAVRFPRRQFQIKLVPGTTAAFEETAMKTLRAVSPGWSFNLRSVPAMRERYLRQHLTPIFAAALVSAFLMLMVALGLVGVLWQNVTQRTRELGLRRAKGATRKNIHRQILSELLMIAGLGIALGVLVVAQVPILDLFPLEGKVLAKSLGLSTLILFALTALCGLYPSWLATRVRPAEALHYE